MYINIIHHKIFHPRIPCTTLILKYIFKFSKSLMGIILSRIYSICSKFSMFVDLKNKLIRWSLKLIKYTLKNKKNAQCDVHTLPKN